MMRSHLIMYFVLVMCTERKGVLFIETSALDSTNVETAFKTLLTGNFPSVLLHS